MGEDQLLNSVPDGAADDDENLDPRIQVQLNRLNQTSAEINRLENELDEARFKYRATFSDASKNLESLALDMKRQIKQAREYYNLKEEARKSQGEALKAARQFQTASGIYRAAKETITLAEEKLLQSSDHSSAHLSSAWQEMLNHATVRVMDAEKEKSRSETEHRTRARRFSEVERKMQFLGRKHKKSISKARPYFEAKAQLNVKLQQLKQNVDDLQAAIKSFKTKYSESLRCLEDISSEIHESRRTKLLLRLPRFPGVGAEHNSSYESSLSDLILHTPEVDGSSSDGGQDSYFSENEGALFQIGDNDEIFKNNNEVQTLDEKAELSHSCNKQIDSRYKTTSQRRKCENESKPTDKFNDIQDATTRSEDVNDLNEPVSMVSINQVNGNGGNVEVLGLRTVTIGED